MSQAYEIQQRSKENTRKQEALARDQQRRQQKEDTIKANQPSTYGGIPLSEYVRTQKAQKNAMALEGLKQKSATGRTGLEQTGLTDRASMADALGREKLVGDQYLGLRELEQNPLTPADYSYIPGFQEYRQSQLGQTNTEGRKYNSVTREDGNVEYYNREGNLAYTDSPVLTTPNVPGSTLQNVGGQSPLKRPDSRTTNQRTNQKTQATNQRPSFLRDIKDFGSRVGQGFQQSLARTRQRPSSDFDQESQYRKLLNRNY